jgi:hypothetical protein
MSLSQQLSELVRACFTCVWIESHEHFDARAEISALCRSEGWECAYWSIAGGLEVGGVQVSEGGSDPLAAIGAAGSLGGDRAAVLVLENFHRFLNNPEVLGAISKHSIEGKQTRVVLVVLSPVVSVPVELEKCFTVVQHSLPSREQLQAIAESIATEDGELPSGDDLARLLDASAGLTRQEAENAYSLSLVRHGSLRPDVLWELKAATLLKSGLLTLHRGGESFASLGGLDSLKSFCLRALRPGNRERARGVMLLSPPGCGKSAFCKSLGSEVGRPTLTLDVGALMGSLVGQSEGNMRRALAIVDAMSPAILMIDEVEKALSGLGSSGDSGVSSRLFGTFLSWLNDHNSDVFVVCTSNDISRLPPEFTRAERFDGVFFVDLPSPEQRAGIWGIYRAMYDISANQPTPRQDEGWTGAEIKSCCRVSALLGVSLVEAASYIVPVSVSSSQAVQGLREWSSGRCLSADNPGVYRCEQVETARRKVQRKGKGESSPDVN